MSTVASIHLVDNAIQLRDRHVLKALESESFFGMEKLHATCRLVRGLIQTSDFAPRKNAKLSDTCTIAGFQED